MAATVEPIIIGNLVAGAGSLAAGWLEIEGLGESRDFLGRTFAEILAPAAGIILWQMTSLAMTRDIPLVGMGVPD